MADEVAGLDIGQTVVVKIGGQALDDPAKASIVAAMADTYGRAGDDGRGK